MNAICMNPGSVHLQATREHSVTTFYVVMNISSLGLRSRRVPSEAGLFTLECPLRVRPGKSLTEHIESASLPNSGHQAHMPNWPPGAKSGPCHVPRDSIANRTERTYPSDQWRLDPGECAHSSGPSRRWLRLSD